MPTLTHVKCVFGPAGARGQPFALGFDLTKHNQNEMHSYIAKGELFDAPMVTALTEFLEPGDTFIDIGSHIGYFSLLALQMVGDTGAVFAFEANPETYGVLLANALADGHGRLTALNCALGDSTGVADLFVASHDEGQSSLLDVNAARGHDGGKVSVFATTLDALHRQLNFARVRMVKIDVEGVEERVVRGGEDFFRTQLPENVVFEVNNVIGNVIGAGAGGAGAMRPDMALRRFFAGLGYRSYLIHPWHGTERVNAIFGKSNYLLLPPDKELEISYGNILATRRKIDAPTY